MDAKARSPQDNSQLRFNLACKSVMNDGTAFPMVMLRLGILGLHDLGGSGLQWLLLDILWATAGGIAVGIAAGVALARVGCTLRRKSSHELLDDFLAQVLFTG
jgi:NhaP-type Na+/H+ or K+/H+ antiporter